MTPPVDEETRVKARGRRNLVIAAALLAFVVIVFVVSIFKIKAGMTP